MYAADYVFTFTTFFIVARIMATGVPQCDPAEQSVSGKALRGHTYKTRRVQDPYECLVFCDSELTCQSYNYVKPGRICELNNRTKEEKPEDFVQDENRFYIRKWTNRGRHLLKINQFGQLHKRRVTRIALSFMLDV